MPVDPKLISWLVAGIGPGDKTGTPISPIPDSVRLAVAAALPTPSSGGPGTEPTPEPVPQPPAVPVPKVPPQPTFIPRGRPGLTFDGKGGPVRVAGLWLKAEGRDPSAPGFDQSKVDPNGPDGLTIVNASDVTIDDCRLENFEIGVVVKNVSGPVAVRRTWVLDSWALNQPDFYKGSGFYAEAIKGPLLLEDDLFDRNGWMPGLWPRGRDQYAHGVYHQFGCAPVLARRCAFTRNANAGLQERNGGRDEGCLFADNGTGVVSLGPDATAESIASVWLDGHWYWTGSDWTGRQAWLSYTGTLRMRDPLFAFSSAAPRDPKAPGANPLAAPGERSFDMGVVALSNNYKSHPAWAAKNPQADIRGAVVAGWPGRVLNRNNNDLPPDGFTVQPNPLNVNAADLIGRIRSGQLSVAGACDAVRALVA